ncbi:MAG: hypothetical protein AB1324_05280 [Candidatus Micrarchaeota archaeon]
MALDTEGLKSPDASARFRALASIREAADRGEDIGPAEGALLEALADKDGDNRAKAARILTALYGRRGEWKKIGALLGSMKGDVKESVIFALGEFIGKFDMQSDMPGLAQKLDDNDFDTRAAAAGFFAKAAAAGLDIGFALDGLRRAAVYGDELVKVSVSDAIKAYELKKAPGGRCADCLDCETGWGAIAGSGKLADMAIMIKSIGCCGGDVTHRVFRCSACGKHYLSTFFDHSDFDRGQFSILLISPEDAGRIAAEFKKCGKPEWRMCKCGVHMEYLKDEKVPVEGKLKYSSEG